MSQTLQDVLPKIIDSVFLIEHQDQIFVDLAYLRELNDSGDIDLILNQAKKSIKQKTSYIQKILKELKSPRLSHYLNLIMNLGELEEFSSQKFSPFLQELQKTIEELELVKMQVAIKFKPTDLKDLSLMLEDQIGKPVVLDVKMDPHLIGGAIVQYGSQLSDHTLKNRMEQFKGNWEQSMES